MKSMMRRLGAWTLCAGLLLCGRCAAADGVQLLDAGELFSKRDLQQTYETEGAVTVSLNGDGASCDSDAVLIDGSSVTICAGGVYILTGTLDDGQVLVSAGEEDKVQLVLADAGITSTTSAAIVCLTADKVFLTLAEGTHNTLANGGVFDDADESGIDAAIFARTDLTLNGAGSLSVLSPAGHGIVSKDELTITGGSYDVEAAGHGLTGKDGVAIAAGSFTIASGKDGIHAEHDDALKGFVYIAEGSFSIDAQGDALSASGAMQIDGGSFALVTGGGSAGVTMRSDAMQRGGFRGFAQGAQPVQETESTQSTQSTQSCKGLKADGEMAVCGGAFTLDTADDAVHGGTDVTIAGGTWSIRTGDDAIHVGATVRITGGTFDIPTCYEGVEGMRVQIEGGTLSLTCNGNGNTAIDTNGTFTHTGGEITTNDGSESGNGGMGGGGKGRGGRMGGGMRPNAP